MDISKSRSAKVLKKLINQEARPFEGFTDVSNLKFGDSRPSSKQVVRHLKKDQSKKKLAKNFIINKTTIGTPIEKSAMLSYVSTPN